VSKCSSESRGIFDQLGDSQFLKKIDAPKNGGVVIGHPGKHSSGEQQCIALTRDTKINKRQ
jgi:hypothetical protein